MKKPLQWTTQKRKVKDLVPATYNPRMMTDKERSDLQESIKEFGAVIPVVVNVGKRKDTIIGGHQRITIYADLGMEEVDVMIPSRELTDEEEKRLNIRLNKNTGSWDFDKLTGFEMDMLLDVGFTNIEVSNIFDATNTEADDFELEEALAQAKSTKIKFGDMFELGQHRLLCGDATQEKYLEKLMGGGPSRYGVHRSSIQY